MSMDRPREESVRVECSGGAETTGDHFCDLGIQCDAMRCDAMRVGVKDEEEERERAREGEGRRVELPAKRRSNFFGSRNNSRRDQTSPSPRQNEQAKRREMN